jgi:hypothetical protein
MNELTMDSAERSNIDGLRKKGWAPASSQEHVLGSLQGKSLGSHRLLLLIGPKNRFGATYFQVFLQNARGETSRHARMKMKEIAQELHDFLGGQPSGAAPPLEKAARKRALAVLRTLQDSESNPKVILP